MWASCPAGRGVFPSSARDCTYINTFSWAAPDSTDAVKFLVERGGRLDVKSGPKTCEQYSAGCIPNKEGFTPYELAEGGLGMLGSYRPEAAAYLREAMIARGLTPPELRQDKSKYSFGVTVK